MTAWEYAKGRMIADAMPFVIVLGILAIGVLIAAWADWSAARARRKKQR